MNNLDDFIEQVRDANPIEDVISESGIVLKGGHTKRGTAKGTQSLIVKCDWGRAFWYSASWSGDVFAWVMREKGCDFMGALDILARRAHVEMPKFSQGGVISEQRIKKMRATADVYSVAAQVFHRFLVGHEDAERGVKFEADAAALEYARGRGWTDETLRREVVGFSGRKTKVQVSEMEKELQLFGVDLNSPAAISIFGYQGDVMAWATAAGIGNEAKEEGWDDKTRIHGLMDTPGLIYAHYWRGAVTYLSRRQLPGFDVIKDKDDERVWKSFNPNKVLAGPKAVYVNHAQRNDKPLICVEGQGDAISFSQLGYGALAFCGLMGEIGNMSPEEAERLRKLAGWINKRSAVYLFLDDDEPGQKAIRQAAHLLGMKVQIGRMTRLVARDEDNHVE